MCTKLHPLLQQALCQQNPYSEEELTFLATYLNELQSRLQGGTYWQTTAMDWSAIALIKETAKTVGGSRWLWPKLPHSTLINSMDQRCKRSNSSTKAETGAGLRELEWSNCKSASLDGIITAKKMVARISNCCQNRTLSRQLVCIIGAPRWLFSQWRWPNGSPSHPWRDSVQGW